MNTVKYRVVPLKVHYHKKNEVGSGSLNTVINCNSLRSKVGSATHNNSSSSQGLPSDSSYSSIGKSDTEDTGDLYVEDLSDTEKEFFLAQVEPDDDFLNLASKDGEIIEVHLVESNNNEDLKSEVKSTVNPKSHDA